MVCRSGHENDPLEKMRHSCAHVLADAVTSLFPKAKVTIGPVIDTGFYYDFDYPEGFTPEDLEKIEVRMSQIIKRGESFEVKNISKNDAIEFFKNKGEKYKVEIIEGLDDQAITLYQHGDFTDLCKGPHVARTSEIGAFKLLSVAGSYWRGDEKRGSLQRIYGTCFLTKADLEAYLTKLEEAKKRDHRLLGKELGLFSFHSEAPASPFFLPKGALVYNLIVQFLRGLYQHYGYSEVITPEILDQKLWERSGHLEHFKDSMYFTSQEDRDMAVKPMNCPGHCLMFAEKKWSYRELPIRFADFGRLHRYERSGVTHGLTRVRTFCQDDAHIYCTPEQMDGEIQNFIQLLLHIYRGFGFEKIRVALATRPEKFLGEPAVWDHSEKLLGDALKQANIEYVINEGEGAFYGPKIEFQVSDALDRPWQLGTLQVDYSMPERFDLKYVKSDGSYGRPVMLHRAILGSLERFIGIYIEHCAGAFPFWLAPVQMQLIPISDAQIEHCQKILDRLRGLGFRCAVDANQEKLGAKIRSAQLNKIPLMAVVGAREVENHGVSLRSRTEGDLGFVDVDQLVLKLQEQAHPQNFVLNS